jgi:hypothetical protein
MEICKLVDPKTLANMELTCRKLYLACKGQQIWKKIAIKSRLEVVSKKPNYKKLVVKKIKFLCSECNVITLKSYHISIINVIQLNILKNKIIYFHLHNNFAN